ncbi:TadE family type IV pilus minor pilin [Actinomycetospora corticicola]|uniref:TadE-like protein n=1 Tax=Actinomycetospora corticicola TaxID=663602 RepID=A0A7Y9J7Y0_9PSEU|nr:TadE family type IV pilus minor pilin [Actinomycetospora corticicola]NYD38693.1 hypothetical protein [Actinomycetospora corticicola]
MATVEAAIALGALVLVFVVVLAGLGAVVARIRCVDAAGEAARRAARDDGVGAGELAAGLPPGAEVTVAVEGDTVRVRVALPPLGGALRGLHVTAEAVAAREPSAAGPTGVPDGSPSDGASPGSPGSERSDPEPSDPEPRSPEPPAPPTPGPAGEPEPARLPPAAVPEELPP